MTRHLFIYWKSEPGHAAVAAAGMAAFQHALMARHAGLAARLYRRPEDAGQPGKAVTLMETYACPGGVGNALEAEIVAAGDRACAGWRLGERHVEVFDEVHAEAGGRRGP